MTASVGTNTRSAAGRVALAKVFLEGPGVARQVLVGAELRRIDEDRDDDQSSLGPAPLDQPGVPLVKCPHRRHEPHAPAACAPRRRLHGASLSIPLAQAPDCLRWRQVVDCELQMLRRQMEQSMKKGKLQMTEGKWQLSPVTDNSSVLTSHYHYHSPPNFNHDGGSRDCSGSFRESANH